MFPNAKWIFLAPHVQLIVNHCAHGFGMAMEYLQTVLAHWVYTYLLNNTILYYTKYVAS